MMCFGCWQEVGCPQPEAGAIAAQPALVRLYGYCPVGGALHIVTDDFNVEDDDLEWCRSLSDWTEAEEAVYQALLPLSEEQRVAALALHHSDV